VVGWLQLAARHPSSRLLAPHLSRTGEKTGRTGTRKFMGQDRDRKITYQLLSWAMQTPLREN